MAEYIERDSVLKAIDEIYEPIVPEFPLSVTVDQVEYALKKIPAADVAPIIRCKDCKYHGPTVSIYYCQKVGYITGDNDFCSYGELRGSRMDS